MPMSANAVMLVGDKFTTGRAHFAANSKLKPKFGS